MELLVVTLAYTTPDKDADTNARIRLIGDTVRNANGLITSRIYRRRGNEPCYAILTTWEDEEAWRRAQERYSPKQFLLRSSELLLTSPEQEYLYYLWGYSRPAASPLFAALHLATIPSEQGDAVQYSWIETLRRQAIHPTLAFAFLARGTSESIPSSTSSSSPGEHNMPCHATTLFLNLLSWSSEREREEFYADPHFEAVNRFVNSVGTVRVLSLEVL